jgi:hypothetical protein
MSSIENIRNANQVNADDNVIKKGIISAGVRRKPHGNIVTSAIHSLS